MWAGRRQIEAQGRYSKGTHQTRGSTRCLPEAQTPMAVPVPVWNGGRLQHSVLKRKLSKHPCTVVFSLELGRVTNKG